MNARPPEVPESQPRNHRPTPRRRWDFERLERRLLLSTTPIVATPAELAEAQPLTGQAATGLVTAGSMTFFSLSPTSDVLLVATLQTEGARARLILLDGQGRELTQSDGLSATDPENLIAQHLAPGSDFLEVQGLAGTGRFDLVASQTNASEPGQAISLPSLDGITSIVTGHFTPDGRLDLAVASAPTESTSGVVGGGGVQILLGNGDGSFTPGPSYLAGEAVTSLVAGSFTGDGNLDLAVGYESIDPISGAVAGGGVQILAGDGKGAFKVATDYATGQGVTSLVAGGFSDDGRLDLAAGTSGDGVQILLSNGHGSFTPGPTYLAGESVTSLVTGDFGDHGRVDLAAGTFNDDVQILLNDDYGGFTQGPTYRVGGSVYLPGSDSVFSLVAGDFTGDGRTDLAAATNYFGVQILLNDGDGYFNVGPTYLAGEDVISLVSGYFGSDGRVDLAAATGEGVQVLLNDGDGSFTQGPTYLAGEDVTSLEAGNFNGDDRGDLVAGSIGMFDSTTDEFNAGGGVQILLGDGDDSFTPGPTAVAGESTSSLVTGDFNDDGRLDLAEVTHNGVQILLGDGDGSFTPGPTYLVGEDVTSLVSGDFNGDGRLDLAASYVLFDQSTGEFTGGVQILLGDGDGSFTPGPTYLEGEDFTSMVTGDFEGDGRVDLAAVAGDAVQILLNDGYGNFTQGPTYPVGEDVISLVSGDFAGDGRDDLAVGTISGVQVLPGDGSSTQGYIDQADEIVNSLVTGDFTGDGRLDLAEATVYGVQILLNDGHGSFTAGPFSPTAGSVSSLVTGDFTDDGRLDLAGVTFYGDVQILQNEGDGSFTEGSTYSAGEPVNLLASGDFNGDGRADLVTPAGLLISEGNGEFTAPQQIAASPQANPIVVDAAGDVAVLDSSGDILLRRAVPGQPGQYDPPVVIHSGTPALDIAAFEDDGRPTIAAVDSKDDGLTLYADEGDEFLNIATLPTGLVPSQVVVGDINGDGLPDLVVRNAGDGMASVFLGQPGGGFVAMPPVSIGMGDSSIALADLGDSDHVGLIVTNQVTGDVRYYPGLGNGTFGPPSRYQAGAGGYSQSIAADGSTAITSNDATSGVVLLPTTPGGPLGLAVLDPGSNTLAVLDGLGQGTLANASVIDTPSPGQVIRSGDFTGDGRGDLAVLGSGEVTIYLADGRGGYSQGQSYPVPSNATGLTVADVYRDGVPDLLVGDTEGDLLILVGNGDGTFRPYQKTDRAVALAVADLTGDGQEDFIYADAGLNRVSVQYGGAAPSTLAGPQQGLLAPGAVSLVYFPCDPTPDLVVANSGSNNILVYPGLGNGQFGPAINGGHGYFTGTNPVGITVAYLNGDNIPDLVVANEGSDDISIFYGQGTGADWTLQAGPRLTAGSGPVSTVVETPPGSRFPDILASDSGSNQVLLIPGVGQGFFDDQAERPIPVGLQPGQLIPFNPPRDPTGGGVLVVDTGSDQLIRFGDFATGGISQVISSGGIEPVAAVELEEDDQQEVVVANAGDGEIALFLSGAGGLSMLREMTDPEAPDPSALAVDPLTGAVYVSSAGMEAASLLPASFLAPGTTGGGGSSTGGEGSQGSQLSLQVAQLQPLGGGATLALVASLATVTLTAEEAQVGAAAVEATSTTAALPNQSPRRDDPLTPVVEETEAPDREATPPGTANGPAPLSPLLRFLYGLDEAFERARLEVERALGVPKAEAGDVGPAIEAIDALLSRWSPGSTGGPGTEMIRGPIRGGAAATRAIEVAPREDTQPGPAASPAGSSGAQVPNRPESTASGTSPSVASTSIAILAFSRAFADRPPSPRRSRAIARTQGQ